MKLGRNLGLGKDSALARHRTSAAALAVVGLLASCSEFARIEVLNDTGVAITIDRDAHYSWQAKKVTLEPGARRTFVGGEVLANGGLLSAGRCRYQYDLRWALPESDRARGPALMVV